MSGRADPLHIAAGLLHTGGWEIQLAHFNRAGVPRFKFRWAKHGTKWEAVGQTLDAVGEKVRTWLEARENAGDPEAVAGVRKGWS